MRPPLDVNESRAGVQVHTGSHRFPLGGPPTNDEHPTRRGETNARQERCYCIWRPCRCRDSSAQSASHDASLDSGWSEAAESKGRTVGKYSDTYAAERLAKYLTKWFCYCPAFGWMRWDGKVWAEVSDDVVIETSRKRHKAMYTKALGESVLASQTGQPNPAIKRLLSLGGIEACVRLCRGVLHVDADKFNRKRHLLNTKSCIVDLRTGKTLPHEQKFYFTKITAVAYDRSAKHPDWTATLAAIRPDTRPYMQVRAGQAITGFQPEDDKVVFGTGGGENGKSTFIGGITTPLGNYYRQISDKVLLSDVKAHSTELTDLFGLRLAVIEELPEGTHLNAILLKKSTGQEITARRMNKDTFTWASTHSMFVTSNYTTYVAETDWGTWRRLEQVAFPYTYVKSEGDLKGKDKSYRVGDAGLRDRVRDDPAVQRAALRWLVDGAKRWYDNGKKMPPPPKSVVRDTLDWRMKSDLVMRYWEECLMPAPNHYIPSTDFLLHFNKWLADDGHSPWSAKTFSERFGNHEKSKCVTGPKQWKASKSTTLVVPPDIGQGGNDGQIRKSFTAGKVYMGLRYKEEL